MALICTKLLNGKSKLLMENKGQGIQYNNLPSNYNLADNSVRLTYTRFRYNSTKLSGEKVQYDVQFKY
jgi:hypothetical protein